MANLLLVDDDFDMADICADVLRTEGHDVRVARNGAEGLARIDERIPDLILCDVEMPVLAGPDMALRLFLLDAGKESVPVVLTSAVQDLRGVAEEVGTPYFLAKPFGVDRLLEMVARALGERVAPKPRFSIH
jgi:DNA-binding NtrC family response regulator